MLVLKSEILKICYTNKRMEKMKIRIKNLYEYYLSLFD